MKILKTDHAYDPEGLNIPSGSEILFEGSEEDCKKKFTEIFNECKLKEKKNGYSTYNYISVKGTPNDNEFSIYYGCCQERVYYSLIRR